MACKQFRSVSGVRARLKFLLLGISTLLLILVSQGVNGSLLSFPEKVNAHTSQQQAQALTQLGHKQLDQGQAEAALQTWQNAIKVYQQLRNQEGINGSLINQSLALQAMGQYPRACTTLLQALDLEQWVCQVQLPMDQAPEKPVKLLTQALQAKPNTPVTILGLHNLGTVLRLTGKLDESELVLQQALTRVDNPTRASTASEVQLSLANTERSLYSRAKDRAQTTGEPLSQALAVKSAQEKLKSALNLYQKSGEAATSRGIALKANLNRLSLILDLHLWSQSEAGRNLVALQVLQQETQPQIQPLLGHLLNAQFTVLPAIQSVYGRLNLANSLLQITQSPDLSQQLFPAEQPLPIALKIAQAALHATQQVDNPRATSYALGTLGKLYVQGAQPELAKQQFETALATAQSVQAWDIAYQWQQQLGRHSQQAGNYDQALQAYEASTASLDQVRGNLLSINPEEQFSFKEKVEPVYREYMRLLIAGPSPNLEQIIQTNERLQLAELENFLQCGKLEFVSLAQAQNLTNPPAVVHIIDLGDQIEVIARSSDRSLHRHTPDDNSVRLNTQNLLSNLQDNRLAYINESSLLLYSQALYHLLLEPLKPYLPKPGTLVFVLDNSLQNIPMSLLHDGQRYLLERYSIANTLGTQIRQPKILPPDQMKALIAGLSEKSPSFNAPNAPKGLSPLPEVKIEVANIRDNTVSSVALLNADFTRKRFQEAIDAFSYPVVHLSTHGQFSSDPEQTLVLAWNQVITVRQLNTLLRSKTQDNQDVIELLVLSACQTAVGDKRSALGIAGIVAQAGARSTVASLWRVDAQSTTQLMSEFYKGLRHGLPKAEALRQAQLTLRSSPEFGHPYHWAPFILVGSWL